jgi:peroxiredoxin
VKTTSSQRWNFAALALLALAASVIPAPATSAEEPADPAALEKAVKDFALTDIVSGKTVKLSDQKGKVVVLVWHSPYCSACPAYDGRLQEFVEEYRKGDEKSETKAKPADENKTESKKGKVVVLGINSNSSDSPEDVRDYVMQHGLNFPMLRDADGSVAAYFGIEQTATFLVIDDKGVLRYRGGFDDNPTPELVKRHYVKDAVEAILAGKKFLLRETLAFG